MLSSRKIKKIKDDILGTEYSLSVAFVTPQKSRELNKKYRKKDKATNVLSFSLRPDTGELVLCISVIKKEAKERKFDRDFDASVIFLVIHGMLHLKGMEHSSTIGRKQMERAEDSYCKKYDKEYFYRNRRGNDNDTSRGGRIPKGRKKS